MAPKVAGAKARAAAAKTVPTTSSVKGFLDGCPIRSVARIATPCHADDEGHGRRAPHVGPFDRWLRRGLLSGLGRALEPRAAARVLAPQDGLELYLIDGIERHAADLPDLGEHTRGKGSLYLSRLSDVDLKVLGRILAAR